MRKQEYISFAKNVNHLLNDFGATQDERGAYYINTNYGSLRVSVEPFKPRMSCVWLFTKIEKPELVYGSITSSRDFNQFNGKFNNVSDNLSSLFRWLEQYVIALTA